MRFRRPWNAEQCRIASAEYESFRRHVRLLRRAFPPLTGEQRRIWRQYRDYVHALGLELLKMDPLVNVEEVNDLIELARWSTAEYFRVCNFDE